MFLKNKFSQNVWIVLVACLTFRYAKSCNLPNSWSGTWSNQQSKDHYHDKETYVFNSATVSNTHNSLSQKMIDELHFLNRGKCLNNKDERYFFYDKHEKCYRCMFIIQRHFNVIQYRETHCDEELTKFEDLCELLTPDLPLLTMIREDAISEKCPLGDSYKVFSKKSSSFNQIGTEGSNGVNDYLRASNKEPNICFKKPESSIISNCPDNSMIRLDFQECFDVNLAQNNDYKIRKVERNKTGSENGLVAECIAHWNEGNLNYLILKQRNQKTNRNKNFKCLIFKDLDRPFKNQNNNILNPTNNLIQLSLSEDEFCRDFYATQDGTNSFTLEKIKQKTMYSLNNQNNFCKFPKILNKKWKNLFQNKIVYKSNSNFLQIVQNSKLSRARMNKKNYDLKQDVLYKFSCQESLTKHFINNNEIDISIQNDYKNYDFDYLVNDLFDCSSKQHCLSIRFKSDFIMQIQYANYDPINQQCLFDDKNIIYEDLFSIDTDTGTDCPFTNRVYQLSSDKIPKDNILKKRSLINKQSQFSLVFEDESLSDSNKITKSECEHFLKIGCTSKDYAIHKKCKYNVANENFHFKPKRDSYSAYSLPLFRNNIYFGENLPIVESETNRICLAHWKIKDDPDFLRVNYDDDAVATKNEAFVVLSKQLNSDNTTVTCSIWETRNNKLKIIDDETLSLCLKSKKPTVKNYVTNFNKNSDQYSISVASAMISSGSKYDEDDSILFEYNGNCSVNKSQRISVNYYFFVLNILFLMLFFTFSGKFR